MSPARAACCGDSDIHAREPGDHVKVWAGLEDPGDKALAAIMIGIVLDATEVEPVLRAEALDGQDK